MTTRTYRIGDPQSPQDDDPTFDSQFDAEIAAIERSFSGSVVAVWDVEDAEIVTLVFERIMYWP